MRFIEQTYISGEFLTASKLNQEASNVDLIRRTHEGKAPPYGETLGVWWLDTSATPWVLKVHDGTTWVAILQINATTNQAAIAGDSLPAGTVGSGTVLRNYIASGAITDLIMQENIITDSNKIAAGALVDQKTKVNIITNVMVDSGTVLKQNMKAGNVSEDQIAHSYGSVSGTSSGVNIALDEYSFMPCVQRTSGSADLEWRCRTGTADASTPGFRLVSDSSVGYLVQYRYFSP